jgi:amidase
MTIKPWQDIAHEVQAARAASIPAEWMLKDPVPDSMTNVMSIPYTSGIMTEREISLTEKDATELLQLLASGEITSYDLTLAFCKRVAIAQQLVSSSSPH